MLWQDMCNNKGQDKKIVGLKCSQETENKNEMQLPGLNVLELFCQSDTLSWKNTSVFLKPVNTSLLQPSRVFPSRSGEREQWWNFKFVWNGRKLGGGTQYSYSPTRQFSVFTQELIVRVLWKLSSRKRNWNVTGIHFSLPPPASTRKIWSRSPIETRRDETGKGGFQKPPPPPDSKLLQLF